MESPRCSHISHRTSYWIISIVIVVGGEVEVEASSSGTAAGITSAKSSFGKEMERQVWETLVKIYHLITIKYSPATHTHHHHHHRRRANNSFLPPPNRSLASTDERAIFLQLGYIPSNVCHVSARSGDYTNTRTTTTTTPANEMEGGYGTTSTAVDITSNGYGRPIAIQCYPLLVQLESASATNSTIITPFPTLYWLTCPHVSRAISELERAGYARIFWERLLSLQQPEQSSPKISDCDSKVGTSNIMDMQVMEAEVDTSSIEWKNQWRDCHEEYASERWNSLSVEDQRRLLSSPLTKMTQWKMT